MHSYAHSYLPKLQSYQHELLQRLELLVNIDSGMGQAEGINVIMSYLEEWPAIPEPVRIYRVKLCA